MTLIRNVYGKSPPLIMHPRLRLVREMHIKVRFAIQSLFRLDRSLPRYWHTHMTQQDQERIRDACNEFLGGHSSDPMIAHEHKMRSWEALLKSPTCPEELKRQMQAAGPPKAPDPDAIKVPEDTAEKPSSKDAGPYEPGPVSRNGESAPAAERVAPQTHPEVPVSG